MATSSIYAHVKIRDKAACAKLLKAIEESQEVKDNRVVLSKEVRVVRGHEARELFKKSR